MIYPLADWYCGNPPRPDCTCLRCQSIRATLAELAVVTADRDREKRRADKLAATLRHIGLQSNWHAMARIIHAALEGDTVETPTLPWQPAAEHGPFADGEEVLVYCSLRGDQWIDHVKARTIELTSGECETVLHLARKHWVSIDWGTVTHWCPLADVVRGLEGAGK